MDILYLLIPISLGLVAVIALAFLWAVRSGQFEDMEGPAHRILMDDDRQDSVTQDACQKTGPEKSDERQDK